MRQALKDQQVGLDPRFRYRGMSQTRIETFSDTAFALAITLLVLSSSVPETFLELKASMKNVLPFMLCICLITIIWYQHYIFFLRYGLQNARTVILNVLLLCLILVYVYPLKYLMRFLTEFYIALFTRDFKPVEAEFGDLLGNAGGNNMQYLMVVYGLGVFMIFMTLALMYLHAYRQREQLDLNPYELFSTRSSLIMNLLQGGVALISVLIAATSIFGPGYSPIVAGFTYFLYPIVMPLAGRILKKKEKLLSPEED
ncbi:MAG: TMEM175 family protein [Cytophagales bacterium]|nr:TMEM175 family protein [Cytophagales bacterium]